MSGPRNVSEFTNLSPSKWWSRISTPGAPHLVGLVPVPVLAGAFDRMPIAFLAKRRHNIQLCRAAHVMTMALNFWHSGGEFCGASVLWKDMKRWQRSLLARLKSFVRSDGLDAEFDALRLGRKTPCRAHSTAL